MDALPAPPTGANAVVLSRKTYQVLRAISAQEILPDEKDFEINVSNGKTRFRLRPKDSPTRAPGGTAPPLLPELLIDETTNPPTYAVTVTDGYVIERDVAMGEGEEAFTYHHPEKLFAVGGEPYEHPITSGQAVYVRVVESSQGYIDTAASKLPEIVIDTMGKLSTNYIPDTQEGAYYYKLAEFTVEAGEPTLTLFAAKSHIYHTTGLTCDVRVMTCDPDNDPETDGMGVEYAPAQLLRMSFVSGRIVTVGQSVLDRPLAPTVEECNVAGCS